MGDIRLFICPSLNCNVKIKILIIFSGVNRSVYYCKVTVSLSMLQTIYVYIIFLFFLSNYVWNCFLLLFTSREEYNRNHRKSWNLMWCTLYIQQLDIRYLYKFSEWCANKLLWPQCNCSCKILQQSCMESEMGSLIFFAVKNKHGPIVERSDLFVFLYRKFSTHSNKPYFLPCVYS